MFADARREMDKELASSGFSIGASFCNNSNSSRYNCSMFTDEAQRQKLIEQQINQTATVLANQFVASQSPEDDSPVVSKDQAYVVYKFLNTPREVLELAMQQMQPQVLNQFFRKLAIQLHPDKNRHPQATDAFQVV